MPTMEYWKYRHRFITPNAALFLWIAYSLREWGIGVSIAIDEGFCLKLQIGPFELSTGIDTSSPF